MSVNKSAFRFQIEHFFTVINLDWVEVTMKIGWAKSYISDLFSYALLY